MKVLRSIVLLVAILPTLVLSWPALMRPGGTATHGFAHAPDDSSRARLAADAGRGGTIADPCVPARIDAGASFGRSTSPRSPLLDPSLRAAVAPPRGSLAPSIRSIRPQAQAASPEYAWSAHRRSVQLLI